MPSLQSWKPGLYLLFTVGWVCSFQIPQSHWCSSCCPEWQKRCVLLLPHKTEESNFTARVPAGTPHWPGFHFIIPFPSSGCAPFSLFAFQMDLCVCVVPDPKRKEEEENPSTYYLPSSGCSAAATAVCIHNHAPWQPSAPLVTLSLKSSKSPDSFLNYSFNFSKKKSTQVKCWISSTYMSGYLHAHERMACHLSSLPDSYSSSILRVIKT